MPAELPAIDPMVERILATYDRASHDQRVAGNRWYPSAARIVAEIARETDTNPERVANCLAALSPRNPWLWNVQDAYAYCYASRHGLARPSATTFERNRVNAWNSLQSTIAPWRTGALKVKAFVAAMLGDRNSVVIDVWASRVAMGEDVRVTNRLYPVIAEAYIVAAEARGIDPRDMQATTWLVAQTEGLASERRGRPDQTFKAGTSEFVKGIVK